MAGLVPSRHAEAFEVVGTARAVAGGRRKLRRRGRGVEPQAAAPARGLPVVQGKEEEAAKENAGRGPTKLWGVCHGDFRVVCGARPGAGSRPTTSVFRRKASNRHSRLSRTPRSKRRQRTDF